jgi:hypothetical protein
MLLSCIFISASFSGCILDVSEGIKSIDGNRGESTVNLLENPDFEDGSNGLPDCWDKGYYIYSAPAEFSWSMAEKHSGSRSAMIRNERDDGIVYSWLQTVVGDFEGKTLRISGWIKTKSIDSDGASGISVQFWDEDSNQIGDNIETKELTGTNVWQKYSATFEVPEGTTKLMIRNYLYGTGMIWFDDLVLEIVK